MSHNKIKVAGQSPNTNGEISVALTNVSDVNISSLANDEVLQYDSTSSEWKNESVSTASGLSYIRIGQGESNAYSNSTTDTTIDGSHRLRLYDTSPINTISGASLTNESGTDWTKQITLPSGKYSVFLTYRVVFSSSGRLGFAINNTSGTNLTSMAFIGEDLGAFGGTASVLFSVLELSSSTDIEIRVEERSNIDSIANQGNIPSEFSSIYIEKLSN